MMLKITSAIVLAVVVLAGVVLINGHNDDRQNEQAITGGVRRLASQKSTVVNGKGNDNNNINRDWLGKYVADHENPRNPNHHRAMVEMLIRYGTAHVGKTLSMEDVKDALAIEFLSQVDGKPIPIAGSEGSLFIGTIGSAYNWESLEETGITHIVSAARSARMNYSDKIHYKRVAIADDNTEESPEQVMDMFLSVSKYIDAAIRSGGKVLVHDWEGAGRSSVFIMAYLMKSRNISYERALEVVRTTRSIVKPTKSFAEQLGLWEKLVDSSNGEEESSETPASFDEKMEAKVKEIILQDKFLARSQ